MKIQRTSIPSRTTKKERVGTESSQALKPTPDRGDRFYRTGASVAGGLLGGTTLGIGSFALTATTVIKMSSNHPIAAATNAVILGGAVGIAGAAGGGYLGWIAGGNLYDRLTG